MYVNINKANRKMERVIKKKGKEGGGRKEKERKEEGTCSFLNITSRERRCFIQTLFFCCFTCKSLVPLFKHTTTTTHTNPNLIFNNRYQLSSLNLLKYSFSLLSLSCSIHYCYLQISFNFIWGFLDFLLSSSFQLGFLNFWKKTRFLFIYYKITLPL